MADRKHVDIVEIVIVRSILYIEFLFCSVSARIELTGVDINAVEEDFVLTFADNTIIVFLDSTTM